jgi:hypothetical protein
MGLPPSSVNCLEAAGFFVLDPAAGIIRVPRPAAGMMTNTFIAGVSIRAAYSLLQISNLKPFGYANFAAPAGNYFLARALQPAHGSFHRHQFRDLRKKEGDCLSQPEWHAHCSRFQ